jgi:hypothetical protein
MAGSDGKRPGVLGRLRGKIVRLRQQRAGKARVRDEAQARVGAQRQIPAQRSAHRHWCWWLLDPERLSATSTDALPVFPANSTPPRSRASAASRDEEHRICAGGECSAASMRHSQ